MIKTITTPRQVGFPFLCHLICTWILHLFLGLGQFFGLLLAESMETFVCAGLAQSNEHGSLALLGCDGTGLLPACELSHRHCGALQLGGHLHLLFLQTEMKTDLFINSTNKKNMFYYRYSPGHV